MHKSKPLIVLTGPTASGKSSLSLELAQKINAEIISADSMQIYKYMDVGTAKVTTEERELVPHHLVDFLDFDDIFSVAEYTELAHNAIQDIHSRGKVPIMVGGTGLYISSVIDNIQFFDLKDDFELRKELKEYANQNGNETLWEKLNTVDPELAEKLHPNNLGRVIRGIEVFKTSGKKLSYWQEKSTEIPSSYDTLLLGLSFKDRELLYKRINSRVDTMLQDGLLEETRMLYDMGVSKTAKQAIGYKELWGVIEGEQDLDTALENLRRSTRRYAKRQLTWMRGREELKWIYRDEHQDNLELVNYVESLIRKEMPYLENI